MKYKEVIALGYKVTPFQYRNAYQRWKQAKKRGHDVQLGLFLVRERVQLVRGKPQKYYRTLSSLRRSMATPKWVNIDELCWFYAYTPKGYEVDHIIPICGENVCGLHVPWNLQYLPIKENYKKSNQL